MKKLSFLLISFMIFSLSSCLSTGFDKNILTPENADTLDTKEFKLSSVYLNTDFSLDDKQQAINIIKNIPVEKIQAALMEKYGITLDASLFTMNSIESNVGRFVSDKGVTLNGWNWQNDSEQTNSHADMIIMIRGYNTTTPFSISVMTYLHDSTGNTLAHVYGDDEWTPVHVTADKNTAAVIRFANHIVPVYIATKYGIETYSSYYENNKAPDGGMYVDTTYPVVINAAVYDPGIFMLVDPMTFYDVNIKESYAKGKSYTIEYKVDRGTFSKYDWSVIFSKKEN